MSHIIDIVPVHPEQLRNFIGESRRDKLLEDAAEIIEFNSLDLEPAAAVDMLLAAIENPIDRVPRRTPGAFICLYMIIDAAKSHWRPMFNTSWSGGTYYEALEQLAETMPEWGGLLQSAFGRGLYGLEAEDLLPFCGAISPAEIKRVLPTFVAANKPGYLDALQLNDEQDWDRMCAALEKCAREGLWLIHSEG
jgi:hypothetical protein